MTCAACGYSDKASDDPREIKGVEIMRSPEISYGPFIGMDVLTGTVDTVMPKHNALFACPKCGTVRIEPPK